MTQGAAAGPVAEPAEELAHRLAADPYQGYAYGYPHKTAYRALNPPRPLREIWRGEPKSALELYVHVPFCAMRCGFCNLFTTVGADADVVARLLAQLSVEAEVAAEAVGAARFARMAIGGGTPTFLSADQLNQLLGRLGRVLGASPAAVPASVEASPETVTPEKLAVLRAHGVGRLSLGVQSFIEAETRALGRPQKPADVERALRLISDARFPTLNFDLIYGAAGQTVESWLASLDAAQAFAPDELFLYPLYVRPLTGLARRGGTVPLPAAADHPATADPRLALYRAGRERLINRGFEQISMRLFRRARPCGGKSEGPESPPVGDAPAPHSDHAGGIERTLGLGCGARSATTGLHYSSEHAVGRAGVREILAAYLDRDRRSLSQAHFGAVLSPEDQRRRFVLLSLLEMPGLSRAAYHARFGADVLDELPQLAALPGLGLARIDGAWLSLTAAGLERADTIGPWLYSATVDRQMRSYAWR